MIWFVRQIVPLLGPKTEDSVSEGAQARLSERSYTAVSDDFDSKVPRWRQGPRGGLFPCHAKVTKVAEKSFLNVALGPATDVIIITIPTSRPPPVPW